MKLGSIERHKRWEALTDKAMRTLDDAMERGTIAERTIAAKLVIERAVPIIRASPSEIARALGGSNSAGASDGHLAALLATARARLALPAPDTADTALAPLGRVEDSEPDMQLDAINMPDEGI